MYGATAFHNPNGDAEVPLPAGTDSIQTFEWAPTNNYMALGCWDSKVRVCEVVTHPTGGVANAAFKAETAMAGPVLDVAWKEDGSVIFASGCDKTAVMWQLAANKTVKVAEHAAPIKSCHWIPAMKMLVTGSWDKTIKYWDLRSGTPAATVALPERLYSMDTAGSLLVAATAGRKVLIFNLASPAQPFRTMESPLKFQTRVVKCFADGTGFGIGSIEGRCGIRHADPAVDKTNATFAFKCHRVKNQVHAVNSISFHPRFPHTFSTVGADGGFVFWDKGRKKLLTESKRLGQALTCGRWNFNGTLFGYACSYDWSKGSEHFNPATAHNHMYLHLCPDAEVKPKAKHR